MVFARNGIGTIIHPNGGGGGESRKRPCVAHKI